MSPSGLAAAAVGAGDVALDWDPIRYTDGLGGYEVQWSDSTAGPWHTAGVTKYKTDSTFRVGGLTPGRRYLFRLHAITGPHIDNRNTVFSEPTRARSAAIPASE